MYDFSPDNPPTHVRIKGATPQAGPAGEFFPIHWINTGLFIKKEEVTRIVISITYADKLPGNSETKEITPFDGDGNQLVSIRFTPQMTLHTEEDMESIGKLIEADEKMGDASP